MSAIRAPHHPKPFETKQQKNEGFVALQMCKTKTSKALEKLLFRHNPKSVFRLSIVLGFLSSDNIIPSNLSKSNFAVLCEARKLGFSKVTVK